MTRELQNQVVIMCALAQMMTDKPSEEGRALAYRHLLDAIEDTREETTQETALPRVLAPRAGESHDDYAKRQARLERWRSRLTGY